MEVLKMKALGNTWLKRKWQKQSSELLDHQRKSVKKGQSLEIVFHEEADAASAQGGHVVIQLKGEEKRWFAFANHWQMPWEIVAKDAEDIDGPLIIKPGDVDWQQWDSKVSKFFTVAEVTNHSKERLPIRDDRNFTKEEVQRNILAIAQHLDRVREWWEGPIGVNSWYRPWHVNSRIGSRAPNHPGGYGTDIRPLDGNISGFQKRFTEEWWEAGKWDHGYGMGARKGFLHLDLRNKRIWTY